AGQDAGRVSANLIRVYPLFIRLQYAIWGILCSGRPGIQNLELSYNAVFYSLRCLSRPPLAAYLRKRRVQDGELLLVTNEDGMEERCGNESIGVDFGAAGDGDQCQVRKRVASQAQRSNGTCRC